MAHLSTLEMPWGKAFTNKRYVHPPFCENIVTVWPTSMVMIGDVLAKEPHKKHFCEKFGAGHGSATFSGAVVFTLATDEARHFRKRARANYQKYTMSHEFMPTEITRYKTRRDGAPIHALTKDLDAVKFSEEVFCSADRSPIAYIKVTLENGFGEEQTVELGVLARTGPEHLFTSCYDLDGYDGYPMRRETWDADEMLRYRNEGNTLTDGTYRLYFDKKGGFEVGGKNDLTWRMTLAPYEKKSFTFAFTKSDMTPKPYSTARKEALDFWHAELGKAKNIPDRAGIEPLFYNFLAQELQMFARPIGENYTIMRQGALQRFHWPEAKEMIRALSLVGGYSEYIEAGLSHYFGELQDTEGENAGRIYYEHVPWNSRTAAGLEMLSDAVASDDSFYERYVDRAMAGLRWCERERARSAEMAGMVAGIFPAGVATDNPVASAQQWTFADTAILHAYEKFLAMLEAKKSPYTEEVRAAYNNYFGIMKSLFDKFYDEQRDSERFVLPRDPKNISEIEAELNRDPFSYCFPYTALAVGLAGYDTEAADKVISSYQDGNQSKNGLIYPAYRSIEGVGRTWYTTWAEHDLCEYYVKAGQRERCKKHIDALLRYNVTTEYYQCERYDDHNAYIAPWMPNASANGRLLDMLFSYHGAKNIRK